MKILDKYILKNFILTFLFVLFILALISIVIDYTEKVDTFVSKQITLKTVIKYYLAFIPFITAYLFPLFIFIAVIFFTTRLTAKSEIIAMLSSGMSYNRFLQPYIIGGVIFSLLLLYLNHVWIPIANKERIKFENTYINTQKIERRDAHFRISKNEFVYLKNYNRETKTGEKFCYEKIDGQSLNYKLWAETIKYDSVKKDWTLNKVEERTNNGDKESYTTSYIKIKKLDFSPADIVETIEQKSSMTSKELIRFIHREKRRGNPSLQSYEVELHRRSGAPYSVFILTIIGACMSSFKVRGGSGLHLALGIVISGAYIVLMQFSTTFAIKGSLSPLVSVWIPNILFSIIAFLIYKKYKG